MHTGNRAFSRAEESFAVRDPHGFSPLEGPVGVQEFGMICWGGAGLECCSLGDLKQTCNLLMQINCRWKCDILGIGGVAATRQIGNLLSCAAGENEALGVALRRPTAFRLEMEEQEAVRGLLVPLCFGHSESSFSTKVALRGECNKIA